MTAHVTQYWVETQGWGSSAAAPLPPQATEAGERPGGAPLLPTGDRGWGETRRGSCTPCCARVTQGPSVASISDRLCVCRVLCRQRKAAGQDREEWPLCPLCRPGPGGAAGGAMGKDPSGKERELEGCFWKAASLPRLRSPKNDLPRNAGLIYSWGLGSNWQE